MQKKPGCDFPWLGGTAALSSLDIKLHLLKTLEIFQTLSYVSKHDSDILDKPKWGATCETICYLWKYWMSVWCFLIFRPIKMCSYVLGKMFWVTSGRVTGTWLGSLGFEISMACSCWDYFCGYSLNTLVINFQALPICNCNPKIILCWIQFVTGRKPASKLMLQAHSLPWFSCKRWLHSWEPSAL